ncbi:MAG: hypothetical protein ACPG4N_05590 [Gammaproteobacteria bacterium]
MNNKPSQQGYAKSTMMLMSLLSTLRTLPGDSALLWIDLTQAKVDDIQVNALVSVTRGYVAGANAGYFVERVADGAIAAVLELKDERDSLAQLARQVEARLAAAMKGAEVPGVNLWLNHDVSGSVGEMVSAALVQSGQAPYQAERRVPNKAHPSVDDLVSAA